MKFDQPVCTLSRIKDSEANKGTGNVKKTSIKATDITRYRNRYASLRINAESDTLTLFALCAKLRGMCVLLLSSSSSSSLVLLPPSFFSVRAALVAQREKHAAEEKG